jgi:hypothetical protein
MIETLFRGVLNCTKNKTTRFRNFFVSYTKAMENNSIAKKFERSAYHSENGPH